eukprot:scaffold28963_cov63-Phaeocystis_antarctica.AAC.2
MSYCERGRLLLAASRTDTHTTHYSLVSSRQRLRRGHECWARTERLYDGLVGRVDGRVRVHHAHRRRAAAAQAGALAALARRLDALGARRAARPRREQVGHAAAGRAGDEDRATGHGACGGARARGARGDRGEGCQREAQLVALARHGSNRGAGHARAHRVAVAPSGEQRGHPVRLAKIAQLRGLRQLAGQQVSRRQQKVERSSAGDAGRPP